MTQKNTGKIDTETNTGQTNIVMTRKLNTGQTDTATKYWTD